MAISTFVLSFASLGVLAPEIVHAAAPYTCTWTGTGGNSNFSTAGNWSGCNSAAPVAGDGDNLVFSTTSLSAHATPNNDITNLSVGTITFQGTGSFTFTLSGNAISVASGIVNTSTGFPTIDLGITLSANVSATGGGFSWGDTNTSPTLNLNGHNLTVGSGSDTPFVEMDAVITGSGNISAQNGATITLQTASSGWNGALSIASGANASILAAGALGASGNTVNITSGGSLSLCGLNNASIPQNITVGGSGLSNTGAITASVSCFGGGGGGTTNPDKVTLAGAITLTANTTASSDDTLTITGPLSGNFTLTPVTGMSGSLVISSSNNTSQTPNGNSQAPAVTTTYSGNNPTTTIDVPTNVTAIVDGTYGDTTVEKGGTLKGIGTMASLEVFNGGTVAPGHSPGCLTITGGLNEGGTYQAEIGGTTACTGYDQLVVNGAVVLDDGQTPATQGKLQLSLVNGFKPKAGQTFEILNNTGNGAISNTFAGLPEGATVTVSGYVFKITYKGGTGNDVVLTVVSAPNTGFALLQSQPLTVLAGTTLVGATFLYGAKRRKFAHGRR